VVSATGKLTGYKWGIDRKQQLLESEATVRSATSARQPKRQN
jgi:hypothetical protein